MAYIPAPMPLSKEEFERRKAAGAQTLAEIDPDFYAWLTTMERQHTLQAFMIGLGALTLTAMLFWFLLNTLF